MTVEKSISAIIKMIFMVSLLAIAHNTDAQRGFRAFTTLGLNFAQIDGDDLYGYNKLGLSGGLGINYAIKPKLDLGMELLYSQRGSSTQLSLGSNPLDQEINLDYIEVPLYLVINDWYQTEGNYHKVRAETGLSIGTLISSSSNNSFFDDRLENFSSFDVGFVLGLGIRINEHIGVSGRYTRSFTRLYRDSQTLVRSLVGYFFTFRIEYHI